MGGGWGGACLWLLPVLMEDSCPAPAPALLPSLCIPPALLADQALLLRAALGTHAHTHRHRHRHRHRHNLKQTSLSLFLSFSPLSLSRTPGGADSAEGGKGWRREGEMGWEGREGRERSLREGSGASAVGPCSRCPGRQSVAGIVQHLPACATPVGTRARVTPHCMTTSVRCH